MTQGATEARAKASRIAKWLVGRNRPDEAVLLLSAWAASGPNDPEGQQLLAEALRLDPRSACAKMAFERMEGVAGEHGDLDAAIARFSAVELDKLEAQIVKPAFRKAQVGFNNNVKYKSHHFHVQTEDSGLDKPHVITHLFADGGRIIKSFKRTYGEHVQREDIALFVRHLMKGQQMEMVLALRDGAFDEIIEGKKPGGMEVKAEPPAIDLKRLAGGKKGDGAAEGPGSQPGRVSRPSGGGAAAANAKETTPEPVAAAAAAVAGVLRFRLHVLRSLSGGPELYEPLGDDVVIGRKGAVTLEGERFCHPEEAILRFREGRLFVEDFEGGNGVFMRIGKPVALDDGDEFIVGDQLLLVRKNPADDDGPDPTPTYYWSSPKRPSSFRVVQIFEGGAEGAVTVARDTTVQIGSAFGEMVFRDPLVSELHCSVDEVSGQIVLTDLGSRTGVFVRIQGEQELVHEAEILVGRTRLLVDLTPSQN